MATRNDGYVNNGHPSLASLGRKIARNNLSGSESESSASSGMAQDRPPPPPGIDKSKIFQPPDFKVQGMEKHSPHTMPKLFKGEGERVPKMQHSYRTSDKLSYGYHSYVEGGGMPYYHPYPLPPSSNFLQNGQTNHDLNWSTTGLDDNWNGPMSEEYISETDDHEIDRIIRGVDYSFAQNEWDLQHEATSLPFETKHDENFMSSTTDFHEPGFEYDFSQNDWDQSTSEGTFPDPAPLGRDPLLSEGDILNEETDALLQYLISQVGEDKARSNTLPPTQSATKDSHSKPSHKDTKAKAQVNVSDLGGCSSLSSDEQELLESLISRIQKDKRSRKNGAGKEKVQTAKALNTSQKVPVGSEEDSSTNQGEKPERDPIFDHAAELPTERVMEGGYFAGTSGHKSGSKVKVVTFPSTIPTIEGFRKRNQINGTEDLDLSNLTKRDHCGKSKESQVTAPTPSKTPRLQEEKTLKKQKTTVPSPLPIDSNFDSLVSERTSYEDSIEDMEVDDDGLLDSTRNLPKKKKNKGKKGRAHQNSKPKTILNIHSQSNVLQQPTVNLGEENKVINEDIMTTTVVGEEGERPHMDHPNMEENCSHLLGNNNLPASESPADHSQGPVSSSGHKTSCNLGNVASHNPEMDDKTSSYRTAGTNPCNSSVAVGNAKPNIDRFGLEDGAESGVHGETIHQKSYHALRKDERATSQESGMSKASSNRERGIERNGCAEQDMAHVLNLGQTALVGEQTDPGRSKLQHSCKSQQVDDTKCGSVHSHQLKQQIAHANQATSDMNNHGNISNQQADFAKSQEALAKKQAKLTKKTQSKVTQKTEHPTNVEQPSSSQPNKMKDVVRNATVKSPEKAQPRESGEWTVLSSSKTKRATSSESLLTNGKGKKFDGGKSGAKSLKKEKSRKEQMTEKVKKDPGNSPFTEEQSTGKTPSKTEKIQQQHPKEAQTWRSDQKQGKLGKSATSAKAELPVNNTHSGTGTGDAKTGEEWDKRKRHSSSNQKNTTSPQERKPDIGDNVERRKRNGSLPQRESRDISAPQGDKKPGDTERKKQGSVNQKGKQEGNSTARKEKKEKADVRKDLWREWRTTVKHKVMETASAIYASILASTFLLWVCQLPLRFAEGFEKVALALGTFVQAIPEFLPSLGVFLQIIVLCIAAHFYATFQYFGHILLALLSDLWDCIKAALSFVGRKLYYIVYVWRCFLKPAILIAILLIYVVYLGICTLFKYFRKTWTNHEEPTIGHEGYHNQQNGFHPGHEDDNSHRDDNTNNGTHGMGNGSAWRGFSAGGQTGGSSSHTESNAGTSGHATSNGYTPRTNGIGSAGKKSEPSRQSERNTVQESAKAINRILGAKDAAYDILGVSKNCPQEEIKKVYRKLAVLVHPDKSQHPDAQRAFQKLQGAHDKVGDEDSRRKYDRDLRQQEYEETRKQQQQYEASHIFCHRCFTFHSKFEISRPPNKARYCRMHNVYHPAFHDDIWVETNCLGLRRACFICEHGKVYDVTEWAKCNDIINMPADQCEVFIFATRQGYHPQRSNHFENMDDLFRHFSTPSGQGRSRGKPRTQPNSRKKKNNRR